MKKKEYVLARGPAGVYAGWLVEEKGKEVILQDTFCLWRWNGANTLLDVAINGVSKPSECRFSINVPLLRLKDVFQVIPVSENARKNLEGVPKWKF